tara:strand:+ start:287 stop:412 length:126 start_codon:yes stop_codon:yes gene_type:complete
MFIHILGCMGKEGGALTAAVLSPTIGAAMAIGGPPPQFENL